MAIFNPRTFPEILGEMVANLIAATPLNDVNFSSVWTSMLEAAAQEDDEQYFQMLEIIRGYSLDTTTGDDLDNRAFEYGLERLQASEASTSVIIGDTAITKISTGVYSGKSGPAAGTNSVNGDSATGFPASGTIIIGRGTPNVEPIPYASISVFANYVIFNLSSNLAFDHGTDETIVLSQGGDRLIPAGTVVSVPSSDINPKIDFSLDADATILDGDSEVEDTGVTATEAGSNANVPIGSIIEFESLPFSTAVVTNPERVTNGRNLESDQELRDRIKDTIQSLSRGTGQSIITGTLGVISYTQNKRVVSASLIEPTIPADVVKLFIDDGTGFIPTYTSVGFEEIVPSATGGEKFLNINNVPVTKAFVETQNAEPYNLVGGEDLFVDVGGQVETVLFEGTDFNAPGAATAQEVLTKINSVASLFESRVSSGGSKVRIFARANVEEEIRVTGGTANSILNFPTDEKFTTKLYLERDFGISLLSKDGTTASLEAGNTVGYDLSGYIRNLMMIIDGKVKNPINVFFNPNDFVAPASVDAEGICEVIEAQSPGISCSPSSNDTKFRITSNTDKSIDSKIRIVGTFNQVWNEEAAVLVDRTTNAVDANTFTAFATDLDYLYVGHSDVPFNTLFAIFNTVASSSINPSFEIYDGSTWVQIGAIDETLGFTQNGFISIGETPNWVKTSVNGSTAMYFLRIRRNNAGLGTAPILERLVVSSANLIFGFSETESQGTDLDYILNRFIGQIELSSPLRANDRLTLGSSSTRAFVVTQATGNFGLSGGELFDIDVDGVNQTYTFQVGDFFTPGSALPSEVKTALEANINGISIDLIDAGSRLKLKTNKMNGGTIKVNVSAANNILQFPEDLVSNLVSHVGAIESGNAEPYAFIASDSIIVVVDGNLGNNFTIPCYYESTLTGVTDLSTIIDTNLNTIFSLAGNLSGYDFEMIDGTQVGVRREISTYTPATGTIVLTTPFPGVPSASDKYQIIPKDADQVARLWNNKLVTTISTVAGISASSGGTKVQMASLTPGEDGSVLVSGGTGNAVLAFSVLEKLGVDAYRYFTGLAQETQWTVDGKAEDQENYPGIRAAGVQVEVLEPVSIPIEVEVDVTTSTGYTLQSITNDIKSAVSTVINNLPVGGDVISSDIIVAVKAVGGVFDAKVTRLEPKPSGVDNVPIADSELARVSEENIVVG